MLCHVTIFVHILLPRLPKSICMQSGTAVKAGKIATGYGRGVVYRNDTGCKLTAQDNKPKMSARPVCHQAGVARMFAALVHSYRRDVILTFGILQGKAVSGRELSLCLPSPRKFLSHFVWRWLMVYSI